MSRLGLSRLGLSRSSSLRKCKLSLDKGVNPLFQPLDAFRTLFRASKEGFQTLKISFLLFENPISFLKLFVEFLHFLVMLGETYESLRLRLGELLNLCFGLGNLDLDLGTLLLQHIDVVATQATAVNAQTLQVFERLGMLGNTFAQLLHTRRLVKRRRGISTRTLGQAGNDDRIHTRLDVIQKVSYRFNFLERCIERNRIRRGRG